MKIDIPDRIFGADVNGAIKRALKEQKNIRPQKIYTPDIPDLDGFIYVPSVDLYFQKKKQLHNNTWQGAWDRLKKQNLKMPTINEFRQFLIYLRQNPNAENSAIYNEITKVRDPWGSEWLDAYFEKQGNEFYILTQNKAKSEKLENCLMENKILGIDLDEWFNDATKQGLPKPDIKKGSLYYWSPTDKHVARFYADSDRVYLSCYGNPDHSNSALRVRGVLEGAGAKTK